MATVCDNISLGTGELYLNGRHVGFLKGNVEFNYAYEMADFYSGVPQKLRCRQVKKLENRLKAGIADLSMENISAALGNLPVTNQASGTETVSTGAPQSVTPELDEATGRYWVRLGPGAGKATAFTSLVVKDVTGTTTYLANTDYKFDAVTGILELISGGDIEPGDVLKVSYACSKVAGKLIKLGSIFIINDVEVVFVHTKPNSGKKITICQWRGAVTGTIQLTFDEENFIVNQVEFAALEDSSHTDEPFGYVFSEN